MAEYVLQVGDTHVDVARRLLAETDDPQSVVWAPRPDVYGGGVYIVNDEAAVAKVVAQLKAERDEAAKRADEAKTQAEARDKKADETGLTPAQLGFPASVGTDPGAKGTAGELADLGDEDDAVEDDAATPEDESKMTPAQRRKAKREREAADAAAKAANVQSTEGATQEEVK